MNIGMTVEGAKEVEQMLERLERKETAKIAKEESKKTLMLDMLAEMRESAQSLSRGFRGRKQKKIARRIGQRLGVLLMKKMKSGSYGHKIVIKHDDIFVHESQDGNRSYIPHAIEYGHAAPGDAGGVKVTPPNPFMRPVYERKRHLIMKKFGKQIINRIIQAANAQEYGKTEAI